MADYRQQQDASPRRRPTRRSAASPSSSARPSVASRPSAAYGAVNPVKVGKHAAPSAASGGAAGARVPCGTQGAQGAQGGSPQKPGRAPKKGGPWRVVFWVALVVFVVALAILGAIAFSYWQGQHSYDELAEEAFEAPSDIEGASLADLTVDWDALRAINPDVVGWIYVPDTIVNYPVMYSGDDATYLTRSFSGGQAGNSSQLLATYGAIFLSGANTPDFSDVNNIIYGHNMRNGSMFAQIAALANNEQFNSHRTVYLLTPQGNYRLTSFALVDVYSDDPLAQTSFASDQAYTDYVQDKIDRSIVVPSEGVADASIISQTFALSTCDEEHSGDMRYVLFCYVAEYASLDSDEDVGGDASVVDSNAADAIGEASEVGQ